MKQLLRNTLYICILLGSFLVGVNVFAAGEVTTRAPSEITQTSAKLYIGINIPNIKWAGFKISNQPNNTSVQCNYMYSTPYNYNQSKDYFREYTTLQTNTNYYYRACGKDENNNEYVGSELSFSTISNNETNITVTTQSVEKITNTSALLNLKITGNGVVQAGFKLSTSENLSNSRYFPIDENSFNNGGSYATNVSIQPNTTYYFQASGINGVGKEFLGSIKNFTSQKEIVTTTEGEQEQRNLDCRIDYIEFLPFNSSSPNSKSGNPQFDNFINSQGKEVTMKIHPDNPNNCKNVPIHTLSILTTHMSGETGDVKYDYDQNVATIFNSDDKKTFDNTGNFSILLKAGDSAQNCQYILGDDVSVCHSYIKTTYGKNINNDSSYASGGGNVFQSKTGKDLTSKQKQYTTFQNDSKKQQGTLTYKKGSGNQQWGIKTSTDPSYRPTQAPTYDTDSPCYDIATQKYNENCYELLASIPGIGETENGRTYISDLKSYKIQDYVNQLFRVALGILLVLSVVMIIVAGVEYMTTEAIYSKGEAKKRIVGAVMGLILALGIFLILKTINPKLLQIDFGANIETVKIEIDGTPPPQNKDGSFSIKGDKYKVFGKVVKNGDSWPPSEFQSQMKSLRKNGDSDLETIIPNVYVNSPECGKIGSRNCTSVYFETNAFTKVKNKLEILQQECGCNITITGGSEFWLHSSHRYNQPTIDIRVLTQGETSADDAKKINNIISGRENFMGQCFRNVNKHIHKDIALSLPEDSSCSWNPPNHWHLVFK